MTAESPLEMESAVRRTIGAGMQEQLLNIPSWQGFNNPWMAEDDQDIEFSYINLMDNAERYTGYKVCLAFHPQHNHGTAVRDPPICTRRSHQLSACRKHTCCTTQSHPTATQAAMISG